MKNKVSELYEYIFELKNVEVIDVLMYCAICEDKETGKAYYIYTTSGGVYCFHLISEVGEFMIPYFERMIKRNKLNIATQETETDYYEFIF
jgi:hypothetical protein